MHSTNNLREIATRAKVGDKILIMMNLEGPAAKFGRLVQMDGQCLILKSEQRFTLQGFTDPKAARTPLIVEATVSGKIDPAWFEQLGPIVVSAEIVEGVSA